MPPLAFLDHHGRSIIYAFGNAAQKVPQFSGVVPGLFGAGLGSDLAAIRQGDATGGGHRAWTTLARRLDLLVEVQHRFC